MRGELEARLHPLTKPLASSPPSLRSICVEHTGARAVCPTEFNVKTAQGISHVFELGVFQKKDTRDIQEWSLGFFLEAITVPHRELVAHVAPALHGVRPRGRLHARPRQGSPQAIATGIPPARVPSHQG